MSELRGNSNGECVVHCNCNKKLTLLQKQLKKYKAEAKHQKLWTKYVTEWLLYKFAFDVNLRIKISKEKGENPDSESDDDDDEVKEKEDDNKMEQETIQHDPSPTVQVNNTSSTAKSHKGQGQKQAKKRKIEEAATISKSQPEPFTVLSLGTKVPIKSEVSSTMLNHNNNNYQTNNKGNEGNFQEKNDDVSDNLDSTSSNMAVKTTATTNSRPRVQIVHEEDPDIDIKYDPFGELNAQNDDNESEEEEAEGDEQDEKDPFAEISEERNQNHLSVAKPLTPFEQQINEMESLWKTSAFNFQWILDMKKYQTGIMPCTMFIKRDDIRQWFEYLPNKEKPELSRFRCRLCFKFVPEFGYPHKYWGPVESGEGQLKKGVIDNRNSINLHSLKQSHKEIILRLTNEIKKKGISPIDSELGEVLELTKQQRKQLLDSLEAS